MIYYDILVDDISPDRLLEVRIVTSDLVVYDMVDCGYIDIYFVRMTDYEGPCVCWVAWYLLLLHERLILG